ncbi:MAG: hypothetical protein V3U16_09435 [Candidatus Neomarinimicrobiota bacterium]
MINILHFQPRVPFFHVLMVIVFLGLLPQVAFATPGYGRKYGKPCQTCHVAIPKLNDFGERFRVNGYQLPGTIEETAPWSIQAVHFSGMLHEMVVNRTIKSGMDAVPATGLPAKGQYDVNSFRDLGGHIWMGGVLGKHLSFFSSFGIEQELEVEGGRFKSPTSVHWEQAFFAYNNVLNSGTGLLNLRFGRFELELPYSSLRRLSSAMAPYEVYNIRPVKGAVSLAAPKVGMSVYGVHSFGLSRLRYDFSVLNGTNAHFDTNLKKDIYGRLAWSRYFAGSLKKVTVGGMGYFGTQNLRDLAGNPFPNEAMIEYWEHEHEELGEEFNVHTDPENVNFNRLGVDASLDFVLFGYHLNIFGQYLIGHDDDIDMTDEHMPYFVASGGSDDAGGDDHVHKTMTPASEEIEWLTRPFDYTGGFIGVDLILIPAKLYLSPRFDWVNITNQWADEVDGDAVRFDDPYDVPAAGVVETRHGSDIGVRKMTGGVNDIYKWVVQLHYHPIQPVALMLEYGWQNNLFGYPEPSETLYNPNWAAGMGRVVSIDTTWLMFMVMFAF